MRKPTKLLEGDCFMSSVRLEDSLSTASGVMSKLRHYVAYDCLRSYYFAKVYSCLQYAILALGGCNPSKLYRLNVIHNNIIRLMVLSNLPEQVRVSNATIYESLDILQLKDIYNLELVQPSNETTYVLL